MTKRIWISLLLALALASCCLTATAQDADLTAQAPADTVILTLNGEDIMSSEVGQAYQYYAQQFQSMGMDVTSEANQQALVNYAVNAVMQQHLILQKAAELGLDQFTQDEEKAMQDNAQASYDQMYNTMLSMMKDETKTDEENAQAATDYLLSYGYTAEALADSSRQSEISSRVYDYATEGVDMPEAAVKTAYDEAVEEAKARYAEDLTAFGSDMSMGGAVYFTPEGYRTVKHILVLFDKAPELKELRAKLAGLTEGGAEYADTLAQIDELMKEVQPRLDEITAKIESGEDFQALIDEYGEDGGMKPGSANAETGYYMCEGITTYVPEFTEGGMALVQVGDVSEPILTDYGFHIIRYNSDVPSSTTPYEDIKETLAETLRNEALAAAFNAKLDEWMTESTVVYPELPQAELEPAPAQ